MTPERAIKGVTDAAIDAAHRRSLVSFGTHSIVFATNTEAVESWPRSYLSPACHFQAAPPDARPQVCVVVSEYLYSAAMAALAEVPSVPASTYEDTPARRHDVGVARFALAYCSRAGVTIVDSRNGQAVYLTPATANTPSDDATQAPFEAARLIRETLRRRAEHRGEVVLHAGAVVVGSGAWIVSGAKGAGKTTLVCAMVEYIGGKFIANDRVFLARAGGGFDVRAWPMTIRIGIGTCLASPGLRPWLQPAAPPVYPQTGWNPVRGISVEEAQVIAGNGGGPKVELVLSEFVSSVGADSAGCAPLAGILLPAWSRDLSRSSVRTVPGEEAAVRLRQEILTPDDASYPDWVGLRRRTSDDIRAGAEQIIRELSTGFPVYEVRFSTGSAAADVCAAILDAGH